VLSLGKFEGGVIMASHDARLIEATHSELWVCGKSESGIEREAGGIEAYRKAVWLRVEAKAAKLEAQMVAKAQLRQKERAAKLAQLKTKKRP
jgi:hypothetical protein